MEIVRLELALAIGTTIISCEKLIRLKLPYFYQNPVFATLPSKHPNRVLWRIKLRQTTNLLQNIQRFSVQLAR